MKTPKEQVRAELLERLRRELVGPNEDHEKLSEPPGDRYLCGILWPTGSDIEASEIETGDHDASTDEDSAGVEQTAPLAMSMKPSSIGISFLLERNCVEIQVHATWATYTHDQAQAGVSRWVRHPFIDTTCLVLRPGAGRQTHPSASDAQVCYEVVSRVRPNDGRVAVSLFLVNRKPKPEKGMDDELCLYQVKLSVQGVGSNNAPFEVRDQVPPAGVDRPHDQLQDDLLYRHEKAFAVGHGTAVEWIVADQSSDRASLIQTVTIPSYEVPRMIPLPWEGAGSLDMQVLAEAQDGDAILDYLSPLIDAYDNWILDRTRELQKINDLPEKLRKRAKEHLRQANRSLNRIRTGLDLIADDPQVLDAFQFANRAMALQRTQATWAQACKKKKDWSQGPVPLKSKWRPFQIAFILQAVAGIVQPTHEERNWADLLWFPTGGGKTEAYLGLSAFVMALRRLRGEQNGVRGDAGVNVIMRYTLRLLTIQQFQRAATLICAMELLRKQAVGKWGAEPFRIGLWVGGNSTPNSYDDAEKALKPSNTDDPSTPVQLVSCPWCGHPLGKKHYRAQRSKRRVLIGCSNKKYPCEFRLVRKDDEGIPALVEDEEIYRLAPSLIIGTVDKFSRIPWVAETQSLFGKVKGAVPGWGFVVEGEEESTLANRRKVVGDTPITDPRQLLPPDLIIQDELHLISGPLGTMVGAFETAIDLLCSRTVDGQRVGPKVIASTATIRRAEEQVQSLFERSVAIFPPAGLSARDSFFAVEQLRDKVPGRLYAGIFAPPRSVKTALVRVYSVLLSSISAMKAPAEELDPYYTLVGYFNSLRELGGAVRLVEDDIHSRMQTLGKKNWSPLFEFSPRKLQQDVPELTSRVDSRKIPQILDQLERTCSYEPDPKEPPVDVVLASNMISVGVDVSRLGLMVVTGQPKTTAEYIQATSRVGRAHPGLVVTVYNWARPRDLSHYERFGSYHAALYRYVEAISVTPFSSRARDKALAGLFIAMCRQRVTNLAARGAATRFKANDQIVQALRNRIIDRAGYMDKSPDQTLPSEVASQLDGIIRQWQKQADTGALVYSGRNKQQVNLMYALGDKRLSGLFGVPNSMRDVETTMGVYLETDTEANH